jgi:hypothetical protein
LQEELLKHASTKKVQADNLMKLGIVSDNCKAKVKDVQKKAEGVERQISLLFARA